MARSLTGGISPLTKRKLIPVIVGILLFALATYLVWLLLKRGNEGYCSSCQISNPEKQKGKLT